MVSTENRLEVMKNSFAAEICSAPQTRRHSALQEQSTDKVHTMRKASMSRSPCKRSLKPDNPRAASLPNCSSSVESLSTTTTPRHHSACYSEALTREFFREWAMVSSQSQSDDDLASSADSSYSGCTSSDHNGLPLPTASCDSLAPSSLLYSGAASLVSSFTALPTSSPMSVPRNRKVSMCYVQRAGNRAQHQRHSPSPVRKPSLLMEPQTGFMTRTSQSPLAGASSSSALTDSGSQILVDRVRSPSLDSGSSGSGCGSPSSFFRVVVLGAPGVGKSELINEMAGDSHCDMHNDQETPEDSEHVLVSVHLDDQESTVELIDCPVDSSMDILRPDAFLVVYSVSDRKSYLTAEEVTRHLRCDLGIDRTVYLVANKTDLRRQQRVSTKEGEQLAQTFDCRFLETSAALRMNVDTLLVRVLENIRGQLSPPGELTPPDACRSKRLSSPPSRAIHFLSKLIRPSRGKRSAISSDDLCLKR